MTARREGDDAPVDRVVYAPRERWSGSEVLLSGTEHHHVTRVLRRRPGDRVEAVDGAGGRALLEVVDVGRSETRCALVERRPAEPATRVALRLVPSLTRGPRMDWLVEKAVELGVAEIAPIASLRSVVRHDPRGAGAHHARWERLAVAAMKQSRRSRLPLIRAPVPLAAFLEGRDRAERLLVPWEEARGATLGAHLAERPLLPGARAALLIGPEGGLAREEADAIAAAGGELVRLGHAILRAETAALAGLAIILSAGGEL